MCVVGVARAYAGCGPMDLRHSRQTGPMFRPPHEGRAGPEHHHERRPFFASARACSTQASTTVLSPSWKLHPPVRRTDPISSFLFFFLFFSFPLLVSKQDASGIHP